MQPMRTHRPLGVSLCIAAAGHCFLTYTHSLAAAVSGNVNSKIRQKREVAKLLYFRLAVFKKTFVIMPPSIFFSRGCLCGISPSIYKSFGGLLFRTGVVNNDPRFRCFLFLRFHIEEKISPTPLFDALNLVK
ncbi:hypothetical protein TbgDal_X2970 [Trypanosoma brucei gambiense DAL972]|uniref:T. brucei spp.-specific protein n=1 Tax=Trypanosoma brucei gambiense (strain MHOM/CI/86/DAL972) TaxID=679716 RepID=D0A1R9_TRYB9|nr:hypothetical protein TbgDal_X2970 [Trypanosoma brucei gambiense DAL972]CBH15212.1 hypothetical protein TbgDal_X2970 [Trypanosoma brucei gambiense DAL972]|eukprot:XP_011777477.1 hypothetical protein TbgDal_X2970 [Trypanosoma brucei gambiense DAL972]